MTCIDHELELDTRNKLMFVVRGKKGNFCLQNHISDYVGQLTRQLLTHLLVPCLHRLQFGQQLGIELGGIPRPTFHRSDEKRMSRRNDSVPGAKVGAKTSTGDVRVGLRAEFASPSVQEGTHQWIRRPGSRVRRQSHGPWRGLLCWELSP